MSLPNKKEKVLVLVLIQSFIPFAKQDEYLIILQNTIYSIENQYKEDNVEAHLVLSDDGSDYMKQFLNGDYEIQLLSLKEVNEIRNIYHLNIDEIICASQSEYFRKADLFNFYLKTKGHLYDLIIFLDDDHNFVENDSLLRFINHLQQGYNFIVGRYYHPEEKFRTMNNGMYNWGIQGTTYAITYPVIKSLRFFSESVKEWGFAEDYDIFRKAYLASLNSEVKAIFDGSIITVDNITGRWQYCLQKIGGLKAGVKKFEIEHKTTFKKAAIKMEKWMSIAPNKYGLNEFIIQNINSLEDYFEFGLFLQKRIISIQELTILILLRRIKWELIVMRSRLARLFLNDKIISLIKSKINYKKPIRK